MFFYDYFIDRKLRKNFAGEFREH